MVTIPMPTKQTKYIFSYGKFYDSNKEQFPSADGHYDVVVYITKEGVERKIDSLEGVFISTEHPMLDVPFGNLLVRRDQMEEYEKKYKGKFIPFGKMENKD